MAYEKFFVYQFVEIIAKFFAYVLTLNAFLFWSQSLVSNSMFLLSLLLNSSCSVLTIFSASFNIILSFLVFVEFFLRRYQDQENLKLISIFKNESKNVLNFLFEPTATVLHDECKQALFQFIGDGSEHLKLENMSSDFIHVFFRHAEFNSILKFVRIFVNLCLLLRTLSKLPYVFYAVYIYVIFIPLTIYLYILPLVIYFIDGTCTITAARDHVLGTFQKQKQIIRLSNNNKPTTINSSVTN